MLPFFLMKQRKEKYQELLLNDKWHEKRAKVFKRDGYKCQRCGVNKNLNCHHTYYVLGKKPWEYPISALLTLCRECHTGLHSETKVQIRPPKSNQKNMRRARTKEELRNYMLHLAKKIKPRRSDMML